MCAQRHNSEPFVCLGAQLISESSGALRRGSTSLVETLQSRTHSGVTRPSLCVCASQDSAPPNTPDCCPLPAQNPSLLSPLSSPSRPVHPDSAGLGSLPRPVGPQQRPSELLLSVPRSPQPHRQPCQACMSLLLLRDRTRGCRSLGHAQTCSLSAFSALKPTSPARSPHVSRSSPAALSPLLASPSSPSRTLPSDLSQWLYDGADLTLLDHCLHHIVGRRTSSPTLPLHPPLGAAAASSVAERVEKRQSLDVPLSASLDRSLQGDGVGRAEPPVRQMRW